MAQRPKRETVDLSMYPDLVVIYLGMRVNAITGLKKMLEKGQKLESAELPGPTDYCCTRIFCFRCGT